MSNGRDFLTCITELEVTRQGPLVDTKVSVPLYKLPDDAHLLTSHKSKRVMFDMESAR